MESVKQANVAIGNFDGVHLGHQQLLHRAALNADAPLSVLTLWPHPLTVLRPDQAPPLLTDLESRIDLLRASGAHEVRVIQYTLDLAALGPEEFVERYVMPLNPVSVTVGVNFHFGAKAAGNPERLRDIAAGRFEVQALSLSTIDGEVTCSSLIRSALERGDVALAATHLGRPYSVGGVVLVGDQRGRELGFPTANLPVSKSRAVPADGVYAGWLVDALGTRHPAAISVGTNPTFDGVERRVETHVIGRDDLQLYGTRINVEFAERIRGQIRFDGIDGLISQMDDDVAATRRLLD